MTNVDETAVESARQDYEYAVQMLHIQHLRRLEGDGGGGTDRTHDCEKTVEEAFANLRAVLSEARSGKGES